MAWDFSTEPEFQEKLDWMKGFMREKVEPLDTLHSDKAFRPLDDELRKIVDPLKQEVRDHDLWACHLGPDLGGQGYGQLKLALMNEIIGVSAWGPIIFGCQAPDTGNAEIIAHYGTDEQKAKYLQPLLEGEVFSCFSMTEPHGGSDPTMFTTRAQKDGDEWVINGEKFFSSNINVAEFLIVMAVSNPDVHPYKGMSMFLVPTDTPGIKIERLVGLMGEEPEEGMHGHVIYEDVRVPEENLLGNEGEAFVIAQTRLGGGRIHHAMRVVGQCQKAFDMMCERVLSRETKGEVLAEKQMVQDQIADSWMELMQYRLMVLYTAWLIDQKHTSGTRREIAACKVTASKVLRDIVYRAMHIHGALGVSNEMPLGGMWRTAPLFGIVDGPTEVHKVTIAQQTLKEYEPSSGRWPSEWLPRKREEAAKKLAEMHDQYAGNL